MEELCRKLLGPDAYLFYDQFVVKGAESGLKLSWHQDSGYVNAVDSDRAHRAYITCWCPLDKDGRSVVGSDMPDLPLRIDHLLHAGQKLVDAPASRMA
jgi:hypothetical protein